MINDDHWFATCDSHTLCRMGGNGSAALTQIVPLLRYTNDGDSFLDVGCGSGTTIDALQKIKRDVKYKGVDFIEKHINWLKGEYPDYEFAVEDARHLNEADQSWDIVWSRHVIDHLGDFEQAIDEQCRVAKRRVICVLWCDLSDQDEDTLRPIVAGPEDARITYQDEWTNIYSRKKVMKHLENKKGWTIRDFREDCSWDLSRRDKGHDTLLVLDRI